MNITAHMTGDGAGIIEGRFEDVYDHAEVIRLIKDAIDDIGDALEVEVDRQLPEDVTGRLRAHPVDRDDSIVGFSTAVSAFGGGRSVRGAGGRFVGAVPADTSTGSVFAKSVFTIPSKPDHAIWVHEGTGIYGPTGQMITAHNPDGFMTFPASRWPTAIFKRAHYRFKEVKGQPANPYLVRAFFKIDNTYVPVRLQLLEAEIAAIT